MNRNDRLSDASTPYGLVVQDLSFQWTNGASVLKSCSFAVPRGQFWMLLGTNGSGKSTLLRLLVKLLAIQSGQIHLDQPVGFVFQNPGSQKGKGFETRRSGLQVIAFSFDISPEKEVIKSPK